MRCNQFKMLAIGLGIMAIINGICTFAGNTQIAYPVYQTSQHGKTIEWNSFPSGTDFFIYGKPDELCPKQTYFHIAWDDEALYFKIICVEPDTDKIKPKVKDGGALWNEDSIEIFIKPGKNLTGTAIQQFIVNPAGSRYWHGNIGREEHIAASCGISEGRWEMYLKIPFDVFGKKPEPGEKWHFNIVRNNFTNNSKTERLSCWSPVVSSLRGEIDDCAYIMFVRNPVPTGKAQDISLDIKTGHLIKFLGKMRMDNNECKTYLNENQKIFGNDIKPDIQAKLDIYDKMIKTGDFDALVITKARKDLSTLKDKMLKELLKSLVEK